MNEYQEATETLPNTFMCSSYCPCFPFNNEVLQKQMEDKSPT